MRQLIRVVAALSLCMSARAAQAQYYAQQYQPFWDRPFHFGASVGGAIPTGNYANNVYGGWDFGLNFAVPLAHRSPFWFQIDLNYASFGVNDQTLIQHGANTGYSSLSSATGNLVYNFQTTGPVTPYILGGGGIYDRYTQLANVTGTYVYCDPFFGWCGYYGSYDLRGRTEIAGGWDAGGGFRFRMRPVRVFIEARYSSALTNHGSTNIVPITIGVEW